MPSTRDYLKQLSDSFVADLHNSQYYRDLTPEERAGLDQRLARETAEGWLPLVPGASESDLDRLDEALAEGLGIQLPEPVKALLRQVDGFTENGISLYGVNPELMDGETGYRPGIFSETRALWTEFPEARRRWLLVADSDLSFFAHDLDKAGFWALDRVSLEKQHEFADGDDLLRFLVKTALRNCPPIDTLRFGQAEFEKQRTEGKLVDGNFRPF